MSDTTDIANPIDAPEQTPGATYNTAWKSQTAKGAITRIDSQETLEYQMLQAVAETMVMVTSIRRILMWTMVIIPLVLAGLAVLGIVVAVSESAVEPTEAPYLDGYP